MLKISRASSFKELSDLLYLVIMSDQYLASLYPVRGRKELLQSKESERVLPNRHISGSSLKKKCTSELQIDDKCTQYLRQLAPPDSRSHNGVAKPHGS